MAFRVRTIFLVRLLGAFGVCVSVISWSGLGGR